jgi:hypothetical protein
MMINVIMLVCHLMHIYDYANYYILGDIVLVDPPPRLSAQPNTPLGKGSSIGAPGELLGILGTPSNSTPISNKDDLSNDSEVLNSLHLPLLGTAIDMHKDLEAHDTALPRQSTRLSPGNVEDLWL